MTKDPIGTDKKKSSNRVLRGGCWDGNAAFLVVSYRGFNSPGYRGSLLGLRPVRNLKGKTC